MKEYKSEFFKLESRLMKIAIKDDEINKLNELINARAAEGWVIIAHSFVGGIDVQGRGILLTFKKG